MIQLGKFIQVAADSVVDLRKIDVCRVLESNSEFAGAIARYLAAHRPDLQQEISEVMTEELEVSEWDKVVHLTHTGIEAGRRFCSQSREDGEANAHAMHAPLAQWKFRQRCCLACLEAWAINAYEPEDEMPDYIRHVRAASDEPRG